MGDAASQLWRQGTPEVKGCLQWLRGWRRRDLTVAFERFRQSSAVTINLGRFWQILKFESRDLAEVAFSAFSPKNGKIDFLKVIGPMVVVSDQHTVSRASLLFSIYDFNSSSHLSRPEFFIAVVSILKGLACFFENFEAPPNTDIEKFTSSLFARIDEDTSDCICLGELLSWVYRSKSFSMLTAPFVSREREIFEEEVCFAGRALALGRLSDRVRGQMDGQKGGRPRVSICRKTQLSPDPPVADEEGDPEVLLRRPNKDPRRKRPWRHPAGVTEGHAWVLWSIFDKLAGDAHVVGAEALRSLLNDRFAVEKLVRAYLEVRPTPGDNGGPTARNLISTLQGHEILDRLEELGDGPVSFRRLCVLTWPFLREAHVEACLSWCKAFQCQRVLSELVEMMQDDSAGDMSIDREDIEALYECVDINRDGRLSMDELCSGGRLSAAEAKALMEKLDVDDSDSLSKDELWNLISGMDCVVKQRIKGLFAASSEVV